MFPLLNLSRKTGGMTQIDPDKADNAIVRNFKIAYGADRLDGLLREFNADIVIADDLDDEHIGKMTGFIAWNFEGWSLAFEGDSENAEALALGLTVEQIIVSTAARVTTTTSQQATTATSSSTKRSRRAGTTRAFTSLTSTRRWSRRSRLLKSLAACCVSRARPTTSLNG